MTRIPKIAVGAVLVSIVVVALFVWLRTAPGPAQPQAREVSAAPATLAAYGRVEGRQETIALGASADGIVKEIFVKDGQKVAQGTLLASIDCDDIRSEIELARAQAESARQQRVRLLRGHRNEERNAAAHETGANKAVLAEAQEHFDRVGGLQRGEISRDAIEQAKRDLDVAQANYDKAVAEQSLIDAGPLPEEISRADADVAAAERSISVAANRLAKCQVRAPIAGTILKVMTKAGESYSTLLPHPLFTIADESVRRVRAEVDERDINSVKMGQAAIVTADGFPGQKFEGQVIEISHAMKAKSVITPDPSQKVDRDVLEVLIELPQTKESLPLGLRVTAQMSGDANALPEISPEQSAIRPGMRTPRPNGAPAAAPPRETKSESVLQVAALARKESAQALADALRKESFPAFVFTIPDDHFYHVGVGPFTDAQLRRQAVDELKRSGYATVLPRQIDASRIEPDADIPVAPSR